MLSRCIGLIWPFYSEMLLLVGGEGERMEKRGSRQIIPHAELGSPSPLRRTCPRLGGRGRVRSHFLSFGGVSPTRDKLLRSSQRDKLKQYFTTLYVRVCGNLLKFRWFFFASKRKCSPIYRIFTPSPPPPPAQLSARCLPKSLKSNVQNCIDDTRKGTPFLLSPSRQQPNRRL